MNGKKDKRERNGRERIKNQWKWKKGKGTGLEQPRMASQSPPEELKNFLVTPLEDQIILTTPQVRGQNVNKQTGFGFK